MRIADFFKLIFTSGKTRFSLSESNAFGEALSRAAQEMAIRELALHAAVSMIAGTVAKCEFKEYRNGEARRDEEYYLWNVSPNVNESAFAFKQKLIYSLCLDNEVLVVFEDSISRKGQALIADTFSIKHEYALLPNTYSGVIANGMSFDREFSESDVLRLRLNNENVNTLLGQFYDRYKRLIDSTMKALSKTRGEHGTLEMGRTGGTEEYEKVVRTLMNDYFKPYFEADNAVVPLPTGYKYVRGATNGARELSDAGDTRKLINDVFDMTALAYRIPPALLRGEMADTEKLVDNYLTFCIDPICRMVETEINAKRYKKAQYLEENYIKIDTSSIKHFDILEAATAVDKLISSGVFNINELRESSGKPAINEPWANQHYITRNYGKIEDLQTGGEENEQDNKNDIP